MNKEQTTMVNSDNENFKTETEAQESQKKATDVVVSVMNELAQITFAHDLTRHQFGAIVNAFMTMRYE